MGSKQKSRQKTRELSGVSIDGVKFNTILISWMEKKLNDYLEPQRKGTPKGDPIGFSEDKYFSALLALTNSKRKDTAKSAGVSYGVLRKWRTEKSFLEQVENLENEFAKVFCDFVDDRRVKQLKRKKGTTAAWADKKLCDASHYSDGVREAIVRRLMIIYCPSPKNGAYSQKDFFKLLAIADMIHVIHNDLGWKMKTGLLRTAKDQLTSGAIKSLKKYTANPSPTKEERDLAFNLIRLVETLLKV